MKLNDQQLGKPAVPYRAEKAAIEALEGLDEGAYAYATDTNEIGFYDGAVWRWIIAKPKLEDDVTYYVNTDTGDDDNDGTAPETAWLTLEHALEVMTGYDFNGHTFYILCLGEITNTIYLPVIADTSDDVGICIIVNAGEDISDFVVSASPGFVYAHNNPILSRYGIAGFESHDQIISVQGNTIIDIDEANVIGNSIGTLVSIVDQGIVNLDTIDIDVDSMGKLLEISGAEAKSSIRYLTFSDDCSFSNPIILAYNLAVVEIEDTIDWGAHTITGKRFIVRNNAIIDAGGNPETTLPGDEAGTQEYGGIFYGTVQPYRDKLTANRTYYVRDDGDDDNNGLTNSSGGAFLTIQRAVDVIAETLDIAGYTVTVQVGDGTYTGSVSLKNVVGYAAPGNLVIQGNSGTPSNVVISTTSANCFNASNISTVWDVKDMKLQTTTAGSCLSISAATLRFSNIDFGATPTTGANSHISVGGNGNATAIGNYTISGSTARHWRAIPGSITVQSRTITLTGTPNFATQFAYASRLSLIQCDGNTYSGSGTGTRYYADLNSVIFSNSGTLPGDAAGSTATGGQYA